eukprot:6005330-Amphidinium_carterae.1
MALYSRCGKLSSISPGAHVCVLLSVLMITCGRHGVSISELVKATPLPNIYEMVPGGPLLKKAQGY